jgi:hypothetical protein
MSWSRKSLDKEAVPRLIKINFDCFDNHVYTLCNASIGKSYCIMIIEDQRASLSSYHNIHIS